MTPRAPTVEAWRAHDEDAMRDPGPLYESWRARGPVVSVPELRGWVVTGRVEAVAVLRDPGSWSSGDAVEGPPDPQRLAWAQELARDEPAFAPLLDASLQALIAVDPPDHTRLRKVLVPFFSAAHIKRLEPLIERLVADLVGDVLTGEPVDFVERFAVRLPLDAICTLFGIPPAERARFKAIAVAADLSDPHTETRQQMRERFAAELELRAYFSDRIADAGGLDEEGVIAGLGVAVRDGRVTMDEACGLCRELLVAGSDSTVNHLASAVLLLGTEPGLLDRVRDDSDRRETFIEEALRLEPPFSGFWRRATRDVELGGVTVPAGDHVLLCFPAANRDRDAVPRPRDVDLDRPMPKRHLTFGQGIHFCVGAPLARLESAASFAALLPQTARIELLEPPERLRWKPSVQVRGLEALPVRFVPRAPG